MRIVAREMLKARKELFVALLQNCPWGRVMTKIRLLYEGLLEFTVINHLQVGAKRECPCSESMNYSVMV